jgi:asparagine synthase (glutamine-hydrolysing)
MCGIAGYAGPHPPGRDRIERALALLRHRGPDHAAYREFTTPDGRHVTLMYVRLSIIDLDPRANQPLRAGPLWLTYNGELYNYLEVRSRLEREGVEFGTQSDTEVLAKALEHLGWDALDSCEGMWAFASYDEADGTFALCRDRFGEKPLYVHRDNEGGLWFASEPKALFALLGRALPPNLDQIRRFLVNGYKSLYKHGETFFEGLTELEPGSLLTVSGDGREQTRRYWTAPEPDPDDDMDFDDAVAGTRERLIRSVELRLRADVPLAFCMSGGVDSVSLISIAARELGEDLHGFTIVNSDARYEEQAMVELAKSELGIRHTAVALDTTDFLERLRAIVRQHDSPVATISYFVQWLLMGAIHQHGYRVSVSGTAADELFSGYYDHHLAYLREVREDAVLHARARAAWEEHVRPLVRNPYLREAELFVRDASFRDHIYFDAPEFAGWLCNGFAGAGAPEPFDERAFTRDLLRNRMLNELFAEAVPVILHEDDLNAMSFSIENRSPFLDRELFEFSLTIPTRHLIRDGRAKAVLREAMRGIAPDAVLDNRRKVGFNAPLLDLLDTSDPATRTEVLADGPIWEIVDRDRVAELLDRDELPNSRSKFLFSVLASKMFLEEWGCG